MRVLSKPEECMGVCGAVSHQLFLLNSHDLAIIFITQTLSPLQYSILIHQEIARHVFVFHFGFSSNVTHKLHPDKG